MNPRPYAVLLTAGLLMAQAPRKPFQSRGSSTIAYGVNGVEETVAIDNVSFQLIDRLVLRKTTRSTQVLGEKGGETKVMLEAWPLGSDAQKPLYAVAAEAVDAFTKDNSLLVFDRGVEDVEWWSIYKLVDGRQLFDTHVPLVAFSITNEVQTQRYAGLETPPDDTPDARLKADHVVGVLTYASAEKVIREALITCDNPARAKELRSYWDQKRTLSVIAGQPYGSPPSLRIAYSSNEPRKAPVTVALTVGIAKDDLDLAHAKLPPGLRIAAWRR